MTRYYQVSVSTDAWFTSLVIHAWLFVLLLLIPVATPLALPPFTEPLELTLLDLGPAGDQLTNADDRPAPKPLPARPVQHAANHRLAVVPPAPADPEQPVERTVHQPTAPDQAAQIAKHDEPDALALAAEELRRNSVLQERERELAAAAMARSLSEQGSSKELAAGGMAANGRGLTGNLAGRKVLHIEKPVYPPGAEARQVEGMVYARLRVAPGGQVIAVDITRSTGDLELDQVAQEAFRRWRFSPLPDDHAGVDQIGEVRLTFVLR
ncbi:MAG: energy transducer TonB [Cyanobacteria bacterium NC_groundwater_1444_Ag_S-0.65um_54_12]|nr:energy transducer TonB [Cyanobacteria bacterium NC_groundwater_1444_Ag_S-0.65um_54_12]